MRRPSPRHAFRLSAAVLLLAAVLPGCRRGAVAEVEVEKVARRPILRSTVTASGEIVAVRYAEIGSSVMGKLVALQAARDLARGRELRGQGLLPQSDYDTQRAAADATQAQVDAASRRAAQARAQLARARDLLGKTQIVAPLDGVVTRLPVREGEMVVIGIQNMPGTTLMTISDLSEIDAEVKVAEADVLRVKVAQPATVTLEALSGRELPGAVVEVGASALPVVGAGAAAREFKVKVRVKGDVAGLRPGLTCDTEILVGEAKDALTVPLQAVVLRGTPGQEKTGVFGVEGGVARFLPVEAGMIGGLEMEVKGLAEGREIVAGPWQTLRDLQDGARVKAARAK